MNYKFKYFLYYTCVLSAIFIGIIILMAIVEIISTKSFSINVDLPNIHFAFLGIMMVSFLVSYTFIPFSAKPSVETYVFTDKTEKDYMLEQIDGIIEKTSKERNVLSRKKTEDVANKKVYSSGIKILDYVMQPIIVTIDEDSMTVDSNFYFTNKISRELKNNKNKEKE